MRRREQHDLLIPIEVVPISDDVVAVLVHGDVDLTGAGELRAVLADACAGPQRTVLLDLSGVRFISSTGMGVLAQQSRALAEAGRTLQIRGCPGRILQAFQVTGLDHVLDITEA